MGYDFISDPGLQGVFNGWDKYITGDTLITIMFLFLLVLAIGFIFKIEPNLLTIFLLPLGIVTIALGFGQAFGYITLLIIGLIAGLIFIELKRG